MYICEYIYIKVTRLLMHMHANIHMYICCVLQLTYMHGSVMCIHISIYIHMSIIAMEKKLTRNQFDWINQAK